jgi:bacterioferritin-associated ferredoxin
VTSDQVSAAIDDGAATLKSVAKATRACTSCGMCRERIAGMLAERKERPLETAQSGGAYAVQAQSVRAA